MRNQDEPVIRVFRPHQCGSKQWRSAQVKRTACLLSSKLLCLIMRVILPKFAKIHHRQPHLPPCRMDDLNQSTILNVITCTPDFVSPNDFSKTSLQDGYLERALHPNRDALVVKRKSRHAAFAKHELFLR